MDDISASTHVLLLLHSYALFTEFLGELTPLLHLSDSLQEQIRVRRIDWWMRTTPQASYGTPRGSHHTLVMFYIQMWALCIILGCIFSMGCVLGRD